MIKILYVIIFMVSFAAALVLGYIEVEKYFRLQSIQTCLTSAKDQFINTHKEQVTTPDNYWYNFCMKEKGYR